MWWIFRILFVLKSRILVFFSACTSIWPLWSPTITTLQSWSALSSAWLYRWNQEAGPRLCAGKIWKYLQNMEFFPVYSLTPCRVGGGYIYLLTWYSVIASDDCISTLGLFTRLTESSWPRFQQLLEDRSGAFWGLIRPDILVWMKRPRLKATCLLETSVLKLTYEGSELTGWNLSWGGSAVNMAAGLLLWENHLLLLS